MPGRRPRRGAARAAATESPREEAQQQIQQSSESELPSDPLTTLAQPDAAASSPPSQSVALPVSEQSDTAHNTITEDTSVLRAKRPIRQPRGGRRSQAKLQEIQNAEDQKRIAEANARLGAESFRGKHVRPDDSRVGGRGGAVGRGRGRGGHISTGDREPAAAIASGPFGAAQAAERNRPKTRGVSARTTQTRTNHTASTTTNTSATRTTADGKVVKRESGSDQVPSGAGRVTSSGVSKVDDDVVMVTERPRIIAEDGGYISSDEDEEVKAIQRLNVEELGIVDLTQDNAEYDTFAPVRVVRVLHHQRTGRIADGSSNTEPRGAANASSTARFSSSPERRRIKQRNRAVELAGDEKPSFQATYSESDSDDYPRVQIKRDPDPLVGPNTSGDGTIDDRPSSPDAVRKAKGKGRVRTDGQPYDDELEGQEERQRLQDDLQTMRNEFGSVSKDDMDIDGALSPEDRANKVYLLQFPPVMPDLLPVTIKQDPEAAAEQSDPMAIDETPDTKNDPVPKPRTGAVGKLRIHASGRVSIDWGGTSMCLSMGTEASFLQDVLVARLPDSKGDENAAVGSAMGMGQVRAKMVVTPNVEEMLR